MHSQPIGWRSASPVGGSRALLDAVVLPTLVDLTACYGVETWYCCPDEPEHIAALQTALGRAQTADSWMDLYLRRRKG